MNNIDLQDHDILILENIRKNSDRVKQRDLARIVGISLGMTNAVLKRLVKRGLLIIRKINNRSVQYAVSPAGVNAIARRSYHYLKRTIKNLVDYRDMLENLVLDIKRSGFGTVVLVGKSDLEFIVEHFCRKKRIRFERAIDPYSIAAGSFVIYSENHSGDCPGSPGNCISLSDLLLKAEG